jgi:hypothetical protein
MRIHRHQVTMNHGFNGELKHTFACLSDKNLGVENLTTIILGGRDKIIRLESTGAINIFLGGEG